MPIYDEAMDKLEEVLEDCSRDKIKATDIEVIHEIIDSLYKLHKINMLEDVEHGRYGDDRYDVHHDDRHYGTRRSRDSRGRYRGRYGHDKEMMIEGLEEKMKDLNGDDQEVLRRAINIVERR